MKYRTAFLASFAVACSSSDPQTTSLPRNTGGGRTDGSGKLAEGPDRLTENEFCTQTGAQLLQCDGIETLPTSFAAECKKNFACVSSAYEDAAIRGVLSCLAPLSMCGAGEVCLEQVTASATRNLELSDKCAAKYAACEETEESFDHDLCPALRILKSEVVDAILPCLEKPCNQIRKCTVDAAESRGVRACIDT